MEKIVYKHTGKMIAMFVAGILDRQYSTDKWEFTDTDAYIDGSVVYLRKVLYGISLIDLYCVAVACGIDPEAVSLCTCWGDQAIAIGRYDGSPIFDDNCVITSATLNDFE